MVSSLAASILIARFVNLKAYAAILWIPIFFICLMFVPRLIPLPVPRLVLAWRPARKQGWSQSLRLFVLIWMALSLYMLIYGFAWGWGAFLVGASDQDIREIADMWSVPLGWVNPAFIVRPDRSFPAVLGIVTANCYFYALGITITFQIVHKMLSRGRVTQLGLSGHTVDDDDDLP